MKSGVKELRCQYCEVPLGAYTDSETEKKVAMVIVHRGVCSAKEKWPQELLEMPVPQARTWLTELFDTAEPVKVVEHKDPAVAFSNAAGAAELGALKDAIAKLPSPTEEQELVEFAVLGLCELEQWFQELLNNANEDTMRNMVFKGDKERWEKFRAYAAQRGGIAVTLDFGPPKEVNHDERVFGESELAYAQKEQRSDGWLRGGIMAQINMASREQKSNTPDHLLADYLLMCLQAFESTTQARDDWYNVHPKPGRSYELVQRSFDK